MLNKMMVASLIFGLFVSFSVNSAVQDDWVRYKQIYVSPEGRIIDTGNGNVSHSEGQGFGLLLAVNADDRKTFDLIWHWTFANLQIRDDKLFAWRWQTQVGVDDRNNASDGDLLIAWALALAGKRWQDDHYVAAATAIAVDIRSKLTKSSSFGLLLLPGEQGFVQEQGMLINPSYWIFPAFDILNQVDPASAWSDLKESGLRILSESHYGRWQLPSDWLWVTKKLSLPENRSQARFGYDAIRIPLYLRWARLTSATLLQPYLNFWNYFSSAPFVPAWTDLRDDSVDSYMASVGIRHVMALTYRALQQTPPDILNTVVNNKSDYYSASLALLSQLAEQ